jgi:hypothetical protein
MSDNIIVANDGKSGPGPGVTNFRQEGTDAGNEAPGIGLPNEESNTSADGPPGRSPFSPGAGIDNFHAVVEANDFAPGLGVPSEEPTFSKTPASVAAPNQIFAGEVGTGVGVAADHNQDNANADAQDGPVKVLLNTEAALGRVDGGLLMPGGCPVNVTENTIANQVIGVGLPQNVKGGLY